MDRSRTRKPLKTAHQVKGEPKHPGSLGSATRRRLARTVTIARRLESGPYITIQKLPTSRIPVAEHRSPTDTRTTHGANNRSAISNIITHH